MTRRQQRRRDAALAARAEQALGWARGAPASCAWCGARSTRARSDRSVIACASRSRARARRWRARTPAARAAPRWPAGRPPPRVVVVGAGPAGTWAALRLAEAGVPATILEQGKPVQPRRHDLALLTRGDAESALELLLRRGRAPAPTPTASSTRAPRIAPGVAAGARRPGALRRARRDRDRLAPARRLEPAAARCWTALREHLAERRASAIASRPRSPACAPRAAACARVRLAGGDELAADAVVLAVGHSARAVYAWAAAAGIALERKAIAVGVRIEHPQPLIDAIQYGARRRPPALAARVLRAARRGAATAASTASACAPAAGSCPPPPSPTAWS